MDSGGNSGSLQSSSGGEQECDSTYTITTTHNHQLIHQPPPSLPVFNNHHINYNQNQINNLYTPTPQQQQQFVNNLDSVNWSKTLPCFIPVDQPTTVTTTNPNQPPPRNPKKRTRASRRAPTTVLTTDTNNFRAMVQEFTGIPAPPFASSSLFHSRFTPSFDLFSGRPSASSSSSSSTAAFMMRSTNFDNNLPQQLPPPYNNNNNIININTNNNINLLRPFPQMLQTTTIPSSSSLLDSSNLFNTMQFMQGNPKITPNNVSTNGFIGNETTRNEDLSGNWEGDGKEETGVKGDQLGFVEPWIGSLD